MKKRELKRQLRNALAISDNWRRAALAAHREIVELKNPQLVVETDVDKWLDWQKFIKPL